MEECFNQSYKDVQRSGQVEVEIFAVSGELQEPRTQNEEKFCVLHGHLCPGFVTGGQ